MHVTSLQKYCKRGRVSWTVACPKQVIRTPLTAVVNVVVA